MKAVAQHATFLVLDVYPSIGSPHFSANASAIATCWVSNHQTWSKAKTSAEAATAVLAAEGWIVAVVIDERRVTATTYAGKPDGSREFALALRQGFVCNVAKQGREPIGEPRSPSACRQNISETLKVNQCLFLLATDEQYANGVLDSENEFVPIWGAEDAASTWLEHWPGHHTVVLDKEELKELCQVAMNPDEFMYIGIGSSDGILMFHPADVLSLLNEVCAG
ncbi:MAG: hypothetical protein ABL982_15005 [Vicinamibacterales bacterium]